MINSVFHDVLLLENQVPFFVLENLHNLTALRTTVTFFKLSYEYFEDVLPGHELASTRVQVKHLVDMMSKQAKKFELTRSAKELHEAGVKFRRAEGTSSILDVIFRDGTLVMPHLVVHEWTKVYFRNMIAYEQCRHEYNFAVMYGTWGTEGSCMAAAAVIEFAVEDENLEPMSRSTPPSVSVVCGSTPQFSRILSVGT
ncbi:hypothetical protein NL676_018620 [Syzygium grande]|nr:hypothetical protein NL676_018620 [Syzygium grande]